MQRPLGSTDLNVSALGFGCGNVGGLMVRGTPEERREAVAVAFEGGVRYFDTAPSYGAGVSEEHLGSALRELRLWDEVVVGTKLHVGADDTAVVVRGSLTESLRRLGAERVDLLQLHDRVGTSEPRGIEPGRVIGDVAPAMRSLVDEGLVGAIGFTGLGEPDAVADVVASGAFDTVQVYLNVLNPSAAGRDGTGTDFGGLVGAASEQGMGVIAIRVMAAGAVSGSAERAPYASPGGGGRLAGTDFADDVERAAAMTAAAIELGLDGVLEMSLRFAAHAPGVSTALVGFSSVEQLRDALRWVGRGPLPAHALRHVVG